MGFAPRISGAGIASARLTSTFDGNAALPHLANDPAVKERERRIHHVGIDVAEHASAARHVERKAIGIPCRLGDLTGGGVKHVLAAEITEEGADCGRQIV
ncbi:MAG: hypothetical protein EBT46_05595 [Actinobacteria bacterium]|nr:hypothetical protein [Actinomycetota bacterium]